MRKRQRLVGTGVALLVGGLAASARADLLFDLRLAAIDGTVAADAKSADVVTGQVLTLDLYAKVTGADPAYFGFQSAQGSFQRSGDGPAGAFMPIGGAVALPPFNTNGAQAGLPVALDADGVADDLGAAPTAPDVLGTPAGIVAFVSRTMQISAGVDEWKIGSVQFTVGATGDETLLANLNFVPRLLTAPLDPANATNLFAEEAALWREANGAAGVFDGTSSGKGTTTILTGAPVILKAGALVSPVLIVPGPGDTAGDAGKTYIGIDFQDAVSSSASGTINLDNGTADIEVKAAAGVHQVDTALSLGGAKSLKKTGAGAVVLNQGLVDSAAKVNIAEGILGLGNASVLDAEVSIAEGATLDIGKGKAILRNADPAQVASQIASSLYGELGVWTGPGITSSAAAADPDVMTGVGMIYNNDGSGAPLIGEFAGVTIEDGNNVLLAYTYFGDNNLDGVVDLDNDFSLFLDGYLAQGELSGWLFGDYNYDGLIDLDNDFQMFLGSYLGQEGHPLSAQEKAQIRAQLLATLNGAAVPEPSTLGLLGLGAMGLLSRRRRVR